jgi:hypothetical protein
MSGEGKQPAASRPRSRALPRLYALRVDAKQTFSIVTDRRPKRTASLMCRPAGGPVSMALLPLTGHGKESQPDGSRGIGITRTGGLTPRAKPPTIMQGRAKPIDLQERLSGGATAAFGRFPQHFRSERFGPLRAQCPHCSARSASSKRPRTTEFGLLSEK